MRNRIAHPLRSRRCIARLVAATLAACAGWCPAAEPPFLRFEALSTEHGLSHPSVNCIHQDRQGFMWFGTNDGLNRYDGNEFLVFRPEPTVVGGAPADFNVRTIHEDADGFLWVGGNANGFSKFDPVTRRFVETHRYQQGNPDGLRSRTVLSIQGASDRTLWIGTDWGGLHRYDPVAKTLEHFPLRTPEASNTNQGVVHAIIPSRTHPDVVWLGTEWLGLIRLDASTSELHRYRNDAPGTHAVAPPQTIRSMVRDDEGMLWITSPYRKDGGLYQFDTKSGRFLAHTPGASGENPQRLPGLHYVLRDPSDRIWGTGPRTGVALFHPESERFTRYSYKSRNQTGLQDDDLGVLYVDRTGVLWAATRNAGLYRANLRGAWLRNHVFDDVASSPASPSAVRCILEDPRDAHVYWCGTPDGLIRWNTETDSTKVYRHDPNDPTGLSANNIQTIVPRTGGGFWIGTNTGLNHYDPSTDQVRRFTPGTGSAQNLGQVRILALREDRDGKLWIGRTPGLVLYDPATGEATRIRHDPDNPNSIPPGWVTRIHRDRSDRMWFVIREQGLAYRDPDSDGFIRVAHDPEDPTSLSDNHIHAIHEDATTGELWFGTALGLNRLGPDPGQQPRFTRIPTGLPSEAVIGIGATRPDELWLMTRNGVVRMTNLDAPQPRFQVIDRSLGPRFINLTTIQYSSSPGRLLVPTWAGFSEITPDRLVPGDPPPVVITDFQLMHQSLSPDPNGVLTGDVSRQERIVLPAKLNRVLTFKFAALDFAAPTATRYAYRLEGLEDDWRSDANDRSATYSTLKPGNYVFRVKAANSQGTWNEEGTSIALTILPPWWATWWFRSLAIIVLAGAVLAFVSRRIGAVHRRNLVLETEVIAREQAEDKLRDLASRLINAQEEERRHIARELHDDITQRLTAAAMDAKLVETTIKDSPERIPVELQRVQRELNDMASSTQELSRQLHPKILEELGLSKAVSAECRRFAKRTGLEVDTDLSDDVDEQLDATQALCLYRILQESLSNIAKHADATIVSVSLRDSDGGVDLEITDNGDGFEVDSESRNGSLGLVSMRERARQSGANLAIRSQPDRGTVVSVTQPIRHHHDSE